MLTYFWTAASSSLPVHRSLAALEAKLASFAVKSEASAAVFHAVSGLFEQEMGRKPRFRACLGLETKCPALQRACGLSPIWRSEARTGRL